MLTQEELKEIFLLNDMGQLIRKQNCGRANIGQTANGKDRDGYIVVTVNKKLYRAHRLVWLYVYGEMPSVDIDHINRVRDDNRIENLRLATKSQNAKNRSKRKDSTNKYKGVQKSGNGWIAVLQKDGQRCYLGYFKNEEDAAKAYQEFATFTNKEFAANLT